MIQSGRPSFKSMLYRNLKIVPMLRSLLGQCGERFSPAQIKAEAQLLRKEIEQGITDKFHLAIQDSSFTSKYVDIINQSPRAIGSHDYESMFSGLCPPGQGLILKGTRREEGILWTRDTELHSWRDHFWPFPVDSLTTLSTSLNLTRRHVTQWNRAAVLVPYAAIPALVGVLRTGRMPVRSIVAAEGGVMVIFGVNADNFQMWQSECHRVRSWCADRELKFGKFSMHTLVPISRESRGVGALLYLA